MTVTLIVLCVLTLTLWIEFIFRFEPWLIHSYNLGYSMVSFLILADGTIVYDEYSTHARRSRVMLVHTTRIAWCCLFSFFIIELRRGGLWACPQLSSYSWWGCEYNMYHCWQNYTFNLLGEVDVCELYYWPARVFHRASWKCTSLKLSVDSFNMVDLRFYWMHCQDDVNPGEFWLLQCACQFCWTGHFKSCMFLVHLWLLYHPAAW